MFLIFLPKETSVQTPTVRVLTQAKALVKKGWIQGQFHSEDCTRYCVIGAIRAAGGDQEAANIFASANLIESVPEWNDSRWFKWEVMRGFNKAIKLAQKRGV